MKVTKAVVLLITPITKTPFPTFPKFAEQEHHFIHEVAMWIMKYQEELQQLRELYKGDTVGMRHIRHIIDGFLGKEGEGKGSTE